LGKFIKKRLPNQLEGTQKESKPELSIEVRVKELEAIVDNVSKELEDLVKMRVELKSELAEFIFQTVTLVIALLALIVIVPFGFITQFNLTDTIKINIIIIALILIAFLLMCLVIIWGAKHFRKRGRIDGNT